MQKVVVLETCHQEEFLKKKNEELTNPNGESLGSYVKFLSKKTVTASV